MTFSKLFHAVLWCFIGCSPIFSQPPGSNVKIVGAMKNVMWKGQLYGTIDLDTISNREHLFGLGPVEYLAGELLILDGKAYKATLTPDSSIQVEETFRSKAPFFGYTTIESWSEQILPDSVQTMQQLENFLRTTTGKSTRPFFFQLKGTIEKARIHVVNLPKDSKVKSPEDAHKGQVNFSIENEEVTVLGFYSEKHQGIFTHHDTYLHMHLITKDKRKMGHLDSFSWLKGSLKLHLPTP